jgi:hypothetical protein
MMLIDATNTFPEEDILIHVLGKRTFKLQLQAD